jgi:ribosomal-protein-alanine N-acetyltransferase
MGEDITYSGTASAAMEAVIHGVPAIAISQVCKDMCRSIVVDWDFELACKVILENEEQALAMIHFMNQKITENTDINWAVEEKETGKFIGFMGFYRTQPENHRTEIGYMVLPEFEGKGFVTEAINTMLEYAFSVQNFHSIDAVIDPENIGSARVLEKNGFVKEAHFKENEFYNGIFIDSVHYGILKRDFLSKK